MSEANNPFIPSGREYGAVDTDSRLRALKDFDLEQCRAALALPGLQKAVEKKLTSRIRALEKLMTTTEQVKGVQGEQETPVLDDDLVSVPRGLLGAAIYAIRNHVAAPSTLAKLREYAMSRAVVAQPTPAPELIGYACLDDIQWGGDIILRKEKSEHYSIPFAPVVQAGQVPDGWKLVPIEPTKEMMLNGSSCQHHDHDDMSCIQRKMRHGIWSKMIAAAPTQRDEASAIPPKADSATCVQISHEPANRATWHTNCPDGRLGSAMRPTKEGWKCVVCGALSPYPAQGGV